MKTTLKYLLIISFLWSGSLFSQDVSDSQLAFEYYRNNEHEKAAVLFEKLHKKNGSKVYFTYYINCLVETKQYREAEKALRRQVRRHPADVSYYVDWGHLHKAQGETEKAHEKYNDAIRNVQANRNQINLLANAFTNHREYEFAERTYLKGRGIVRDYDFRHEMANLYMIQRNYEKMVEEYMELIHRDARQLEYVQNRVQYLIANDIDGSLSGILKTALLKRIQEHKTKAIFNEMLIWLYIQEKNFAGALIQEKALDRRFDTQGQRVIRLAKLAASNKAYDVAINAYQYVVEKGDDMPYFVNAKLGVLNVLYQKVLAGESDSRSEIEVLEKRYLQTIDDFGKNLQTFRLMKELAHLQAFYLDKPTKALAMLGFVLESRGVPRELKTECRLEKGDILLLIGDVWDATLTYAKVEKENQQNAYGHEAKFRKAKLAYYIGDFRWAQAQLDVLKASTSKLIANDAFELSMLIKDNLNEQDSTNRALQMFANADLLILQHKDSLAMLTLDSILETKSPGLADEVLFRKAEIMQQRGEYQKAATFLQRIADQYSYDILADNAVFRLGEIYETHLANTQKAKQYYKRILVDFPGSIFVIEARKRFRKLRGDRLDSTENPKPPQLEN